MLIHGTRESYQQMHGNRVYVEPEVGAFLSNQKGYVLCLFDRPLQSQAGMMEQLLLLQETAEFNKARDITNYSTSNLQESMRRDKKLSESCFRKCIYLSFEMIRQTHLCSSLFELVFTNFPISDEEIHSAVNKTMQIGAALSMNSRIAKLSAVISTDWNSVIRLKFSDMSSLPRQMDSQQFFATSIALSLSPTLKAAEQVRLLFSYADKIVQALLKINIEEDQDEAAIKLSMLRSSLEAYEGFFIKEIRMDYIRSELEQNALPVSTVTTMVLDYIGAEETTIFADVEKKAPPANNSARECCILS